jgi:Spy/CpxP family protein refolding chaperone
MYNLLTPEQKKQFNENYQNRAAKMEQMRDHKPGQEKPVTAE